MREPCREAHRCGLAIRYYDRFSGFLKSTLRKSLILKREIFTRHVNIAILNNTGVISAKKLWVSQESRKSDMGMRA
jgi:hypothetical protein